MQSNNTNSSEDFETVDESSAASVGADRKNRKKKEKQPKQAVDMTQGPFFKKMVLFAIPIILTGFLQSFYNAADLIVVNLFSSSEAPLVGAIGCTSALTNLVLGMFLGLSIGAGVVAAHYIGAKREKDVNAVLHTSVLLCLISGTVIAIAGFFLAEPMLSAMGTSEDLLPYATLYLKIIFLGTPGSLIYNYIASILRSAGDSKSPLIFLALSGIANVLFNIFFVLAFDMDVDGVALATIISQYLSAAMAIIYLMRTKGFLHFSFKRLRIDSKKLKRLLHIGIPSGIQTSLFSLSNTLIQASMNSIDIAAGAGGRMIDGFSATSNLENFVYIAMHAVYSVALTFVGQSVGAKKYKNIKRLTIYSVGIAAGLGILMGGFILIFKGPLLGLYTSGEVATDAALMRMYIIMPTYFFCGIMDVLCATLRSLNRSVTSMVLSLTFTCGLRILWINTVFAYFGTGTSLFISYPVSWIVSSLVHLVFIVIATKKFLKQQREEIELKL